mmetsp:Transcript_13082/g.43353  ORF Transcript_13082/g.43353 Transcript_13082/m.43353 type:complete len:201 (+) Transcript_13082:791-1393(+)
MLPRESDDRPSIFLTAVLTTARYFFRTKRLCTSSRNAFAVSGFRASKSNPLTFLSSRCTGFNRPRSGRCDANNPSTVFLRYCPVGCTGVVAGLHTATMFCVTLITTIGSAKQGGSCRCNAWRKRSPAFSDVKGCTFGVVTRCSKAVFAVVSVFVSVVSVGAAGCCLSSSSSFFSSVVADFFRFKLPLFAGVAFSARKSPC